MSDEKPFARVVPSNGRYYKVAGVIAKPSAPQDAEGDVRTINSAVSARERKAAAQALREASVDLIAAFDGYAHDVSAWLRSRAAALEGGAT